MTTVNITVKNLATRGAEDEIVREVAHPLDPSHKSTIKPGRVRKES